MAKEYYVYPNGTPIAVAGNNEYATQIPMSASDATDVYTAINAKADSSDLATVATSGSYNDLSNKPTIPDISTKVSKSGDTMTGLLTLSGTQVQRAGGNTSWIKGRDVAPVKTTSGGGSWNPVVSAKSVNGAWGIGTLNDVLYFSYGTDTNYNNNTNTTNNYSIDSSGNFSGKSADSAKLNGYASDTSATANTIVRRTADKYIYATYLNTSCSSVNIASYTSEVAFISSDKFLRKTSLTNFKNWFGTANAATKANIVANYVSGGTGSNLRFHAQTSVLTASGTGVQLVTAAALNTIFGVSNCGAATTAVFVSNGDGNAWGGHFDGCNFISSGTPAWWATMNTSVSGAVRINWLAVYFG